MSKRKILYIQQEMAPYIPDSTGSVRGRLIPQGLQENGFEVRSFMPKYGCINERRNQLHEVIRLSGMNLIIDDTDHPLIIKVATLLPTRMQVYFIDNDDYFSRTPIKVLETELSPGDNDERMMFFVRGVIETVKKLRWAPEVIHCSGWISALAPLYIKKFYSDDPSFVNAKIVYSLTDGSELPEPLSQRFQAKLAMDKLRKTDLKTLGTEPVDYVKLSRLAIDHADGVIEASAGVNPELVEYAAAAGKPCLNYIDEPAQAVARYIEFYDSLTK